MQGVIHRYTPYVLRREEGPPWGVWALQRALNGHAHSVVHKISEDGVFGGATEQSVKRFQTALGLVADGVAGPKTQSALCQYHAENLTEARPPYLPAKLVLGFRQGEGGDYLGAVNWSVAGGVDCGAVQRRVYGPPFDPKATERAFDAAYQLRLLALSTRSLRDIFYARVHSQQIGFINSQNERAWRLAALNHNYPYAADRLSRGYSLSDTLADWVPPGTKFADGSPVRTRLEWCQFYALGAPEKGDRGLVTKLVTDWSP